MAKRKRDNLDKDVIRAERLGYGCHYGKYKADHPHTREEEPEEIPEGVPTRVCENCGKLFSMVGRSHLSKFCGDECYYAAARRRMKERRMLNGKK